LRFLCQRKAADCYWYQRSFNAFSFEKVAPKEKALQKENGRIRLRGERPLLKKRGKTASWFVLTIFIRGGVHFEIQ